MLQSTYCDNTVLLKKVSVCSLCSRCFRGRHTLIIQGWRWILPSYRWRFPSGACVSPLLETCSVIGWTGLTSLPVGWRQRASRRRDDSSHVTAGNRSDVALDLEYSRKESNTIKLTSVWFNYTIITFSVLPQIWVCLTSYNYWKSTRIYDLDL